MLLTFRNYPDPCGIQTKVILSEAKDPSTVPRYQGRPEFLNHYRLQPRSREHSALAVNRNRG